MMSSPQNARYNYSLMLFHAHRSTSQRKPRRTRILHLHPFDLQECLRVQVRRRLQAYSPTGLVKCEECKVSTNHWSREEVWSGEAAVVLRVVQVSKWSVSFRLIDPFGDQLKNFCPHFRCGNSCSEELPIGLGVQVPGVEGHAVFLANIPIPIRLHLVDTLGYKSGLRLWRCEGEDM